MKDFTRGPLVRHLLVMALPMGFGMLMQTLYYLIDLYFVGKLGDAALAGVSAAGNVTFIVLAMTQILGVGAVALISQAVGRKDQQDANLVFNQSLLLSALCAAVVLAAGFGLAPGYMQSFGADPASRAAGISYLYWYAPGLALQFALVGMGSALRAMGRIAPTILVQMITIIVNIILAPVLIAGWGTGHPMGVAGAALASTIAVGAGVLMMGVYFLRSEQFVSFQRALWRPQLTCWRRMFAIGLPAGGEFILMFLSMSLTYWIIRDAGAATQAGFGIGSRVMQAIFLPVMAIAFSVTPIAGQNVGAKQPERVRQTFLAASAIGGALMLSLTLVCQWKAEWLVRSFASDTEVLAVSAQFLRIVSWNFVATAIIYTSGSLFQALGNTLPSLFSAAIRLILFAVPATWLAHQANFHIEQLWYLSVATVCLQALLSAALVRLQLASSQREMVMA